jgi:hypothetical protein
MRYTARERIAGTLPAGEKEKWGKCASYDGFTSLWTWIVWVVRKRIKEIEEKNA